MLSIRGLVLPVSQKFIRFDDRHQAFETLKRLLTSSAVMAPPQTDKPYKLYTDASDKAIGSILVQNDTAGVERVITYMSQSLSGTQRRWSTLEKEAYAIVVSLQKLRCYLWGSDFTVYTDHKPLKCLFTKMIDNTKLQRWSVLLSEFHTTIEYRKGVNNIRADMLSRIEHPEPTTINVIDTTDWVDPTHFPEQNPRDIAPLLHDGLDLNIIGREQETEFPDLWERASDPEQDDYELINGVLYQPPLTAPTERSATWPPGRR